MATSQERGREFEKQWAKRIGARPQKGSGNHWLWRLDAENRGRYLWSCKHTDKESIAVRLEDFREVEYAVEGPGGIGGDTQPIMALSINGEQFVLQRADDWIAEHTEEAQVEFIKPDKHTERLAKRNTSPLFRD